MDQYSTTNLAKNPALRNDEVKAVAAFSLLAEDSALARKLARMLRRTVARTGFRHYLVWSSRTGYALSFDRRGVPCYEIAASQINRHFRGGQVPEAALAESIQARALTLVEEISSAA